MEVAPFDECAYKYFLIWPDYIYEPKRREGENAKLSCGRCQNGRDGVDIRNGPKGNLRHSRRCPFDSNRTEFAESWRNSLAGFEGVVEYYAIKELVP
jgi:hypothetical protein